MNPERFHTHEEATQIALKEIVNLGLLCKFTTIGKMHITYNCSLIDQKGREIDIGHGKGKPEQSKVSALFEALEHYLSSPRYLLCQEPKTLNIIWSKPKDLPNINLLRQNKSIEILIAQFPNTPLPCIEYSELFESETILYPLFLVVPEYTLAPLESDKFEYNIVRKYASNSGTASGVGFEESVIHGISEILERDANSTFLLETFIRKEPKKPRIISKKSIPDYLQNLIMRIEEEADDELIIINTTNDFRLPSFCVTLTKQKTLIQPRGSGASLSKEYALERAILEAIQEYHLCVLDTTENCDEENYLKLEFYNNFPKYKICTEFDIAQLVASNFIENEDYIHVINDKNPIEALGKEEYLLRLSNLVRENGFRIFYRNFYSSEIGLNCVSTLIPGTESFNLVTAGNPVLPSKRGLKLLS